MQEPSPQPALSGPYEQMCRTVAEHMFQLPFELSDNAEERTRIAAIVDRKAEELCNALLALAVAYDEADTARHPHQYN